MQAGGSDWFIPFTLDLATASEPAAGEPAASAQGYRLARRSFFAQELNADITLAKAYPALHAPTIRAAPAPTSAGTSATSTTASRSMPRPVRPTCIRSTSTWSTSSSPAAGNSTPDGSFVVVPPSPLELDGIGRQDTVAIPSNQIVELLVHYPLGYSGDFVYHCHILEHEDIA